MKHPSQFSVALAILVIACIPATCLAAPEKEIEAPAPEPVSAQLPLEQRLLLESEARREAEHRMAMAETKADLMGAATSRLENWIGLYGILITVIVALAGFFTWRSAANAARAEVQDMRDALDKIESQAQKAMKRISQIEGDIAEKQKNVTDHHDRIQAMANALPGQTNRNTLSQEDKESLASATQSIEAQPVQKWNADEFRLVLLAAEDAENWPRYVELANQMASTHEDSPEDLAFALFAKAFGLEKMDEYDGASAAYQDYLDRCPEDDGENRAGALNNWGNTLSHIAGDKAAIGDASAADHLWKVAGEKFAASLAMHSLQKEAHNSWSMALMNQAAYKKKTERDKLLDQAEILLTQVNSYYSGSGSYNLSCLSALRGDAAKAAS